MGRFYTVHDTRLARQINHAHAAVLVMQSMDVPFVDLCIDRSTCLETHLSFMIGNENNYARNLNRDRH